MIKKVFQRVFGVCFFFIGLTFYTLLTNIVNASTRPNWSNRYVKEYNCISGPIFCGLVHDIGRELSEENLFNYCKYHKIDLNAEIRENIVLSHGLVAADMAYSFLPNYPSSWSEAIKYHTTGNDTLDDLGLALLIADFTEPNRTFLSSSDRNTIYSNENIYTCALDVINRMILHAEKSKKYNVSSYSLKLKLYLECKLDK